MAKTKPTITASTDDRESREARAVKELVIWARREGIALAEVQVGMSRLVMTDTKLVASLRGNAPKPLTDEQLRQNLYQEYGGKALEELTSETPGAEGYDGLDEGDDEPDGPVVG